MKPILKESTESLGKLHLTEKAKESDESGNNLPMSPVQLPPNVEDIDAADNASPLLLSIYIKDIYKYLTHLERQYPIEEDHLRKQVCVLFCTITVILKLRTNQEYFKPMLA